MYLLAEVTAVTIDRAYLVPAVGVFLPILVAIVTKKVASSGVKAIVLALLSALSGLGTAALSNAGAISQEAFINAFITWVIAVATYYGFWTNVGTTQAVQNATANKGIG